MNSFLALQQKAIQSAKNQDWAGAIEYNLSILELKSHDIAALNRLGVAYLQKGDNKKAKQAFEQVVTLDKSNSLAKKHLERIKNKQANIAPAFSHEHFIEEPGKTKTVELHRLAGKNVLSALSLGQACELKPKNRYISVEVGGTYVGALPEDLSFRLSKLIETGNSYTCRIRSCSGSQCSVHLRELARSVHNEHTNSFPVSKNTYSNLNDLDEKFFLEEDIPLQIVDTDTDSERVIDELDTQSRE